VADLPVGWIPKQAAYKILGFLRHWKTLAKMEDGAQLDEALQHLKEGWKDGEDNKSFLSF
jgi:hypothetical protein